MRTRRYGAQTTRTGRLENRIIGIALADGEIYSNLKFTQALYDLLSTRGAINAPDPVDLVAAMDAAESLMPDLVQEDGVVINQLLMGADLTAFLQSMIRNASDEAGMKALLQASWNDSESYHETWLAKSKKGKK
jgi:CRISPR-associated protein Csc2